MTAILITALFAFAGLAAVVTIWATLSRYGAAVSALHHARRDDPEILAVDYHLTELCVSRPVNVIRAEFPVRRPRPSAALRAAA